MLVSKLLSEPLIMNFDVGEINFYSRFSIY